jgi:hypothetical protein
MMGIAEARLIAAGQVKEPSRPARGAFLAGLGSVQFWALGLQYFFLVMIQSFYATWLPTYLVRERHFSLASLLTALTPTGSGFASFVVIRGLLGAGQSADWPSSVVALKRWFPRAERPKQIRPIEHLPRSEPLGEPAGRHLEQRVGPGEAGQQERHLHQGEVVLALDRRCGDYNRGAIEGHDKCDRGQ